MQALDEAECLKVERLEALLLFGLVSVKIIGALGVGHGGKPLCRTFWSGSLSALITTVAESFEKRLKGQAEYKFNAIPNPPESSLW